MSVSEFSKVGDNTHGFTLEEAMRKVEKVNAAHGVGDPKSKWGPARIVPDDSRKNGFKVVIDTIK